MVLLDLTRDAILAPLGLLPYSSSFVFELIDMVIMSIVLGFIFSDFIGRPSADPLDAYKRNRWRNLKVAALIAGPAVVLHELAHKLFAMAFGAQATLYAPYGWYIIAVALKLIGFPFIILVGAFLAVKAKKIPPKYLPYAVPFARLNLILGIFNMIPLPGLDGWGALTGLYQALF